MYVTKVTLFEQGSERGLGPKGHHQATSGTDDDDDDDDDDNEFKILEVFKSAFGLK